MRPPATPIDILEAIDAVLLADLPEQAASVRAVQMLEAWLRIPAYKRTAPHLIMRGPELLEQARAAERLRDVARARAWRLFVPTIHLGPARVSAPRIFAA